MLSLNKTKTILELEHGIVSTGTSISEEENNILRFGCCTNKTLLIMGGWVDRSVEPAQLTS